MHVNASLARARLPSPGRTRAVRASTPSTARRARRRPCRRPRRCSRRRSVRPPRARGEEPGASRLRRGSSHAAPLLEGPDRLPRSLIYPACPRCSRAAGSAGAVPAPQLRRVPRLRACRRRTVRTPHRARQRDRAAGPRSAPAGRVASPAAARARAIASPIPRDAPVTTAMRSTGRPSRAVSRRLCARRRPLRSRVARVVLPASAASSTNLRRGRSRLSGRGRSACRRRRTART